MKRVEARAARWAVAAGVACALAAVAMQRSRSQEQESAIAVDALLDCALHGDEHDRCEGEPEVADGYGEGAYAERS